jgi:hypothetical protein
VAVIYLLIAYVVKNPAIFGLYQGFVMLLMIPVAWFSNKRLYKKGQIQVFLPGEGE